jgi:hypothetical protein
MIKNAAFFFATAALAAGCMGSADLGDDDGTGHEMAGNVTEPVEVTRVGHEGLAGAPEVVHASVSAEELFTEPELSDELHAQAADAAEAGSEANEGLATVSQGLFGSDACKDVAIKIINASDEDSRMITKVEYWDETSDKWRKENLANMALSPGESARWTRDLEYTKDHRTGKWKVWYKLKVGSAWHSGYVRLVTPDEGTGSKCKHGDVFTLEVSNSGE